MARQTWSSEAGVTLPELLLAVTVLGLLSGLAWGSGQRWLARQRLEAASRLVLAGLEQGRQAAERSGRPCGLSLTGAGWAAPTGGDLPGCLAEPLSLHEVAGGAVQLSHTLPAALRFTANGLLLDGGTVRLATGPTDPERCVVVALPLGVARQGLWQGGRCEAG